MLRKTAITIIIAAALIIYAFSAIDITKGKVFSVKIDLSKPTFIKWPCEIAVVDNTGRKGLRIPPNIGRGWAGEAGGKATYKFYIPKTAKYLLWAYALWYDECTNAVFAKINNKEKTIIGNDPVYQKWHWVRGFEIKLTKGTHELSLSNHSDHIAIRKILLTNSPSAQPQGNQIIFSDIFYDGFDGCDKGNFNKWNIISGEWLVRNPGEKVQPDKNILIGKSKKNALIIYKNNNWKNYCLNLSVKTQPIKNHTANLAICFALNSPEKYHFLEIQPDKNTNLAKILLGRKKDKIINTLATYNLPWKPDTWHLLEIRLNPKNIQIKLDNNQTKTIPKNYQLAGGIGLELNGNLSACFDNIHLRTITKSDKNQKVK